jgi:SAM-dependent methyltransferase
MSESVQQTRALRIFMDVEHIFLPPVSGMKVLEIGSSLGFLSIHLKNYFGNVTSVEPNENAVKRGIELRNYEGVDLKVCKLQNLDISYKNTFNFVICSLPCIPWVEIPLFYAKLHQIVVPKGQVWFYTEKDEWNYDDNIKRHKEYAKIYSFDLVSEKNLNDRDYMANFVLNIWVNEKQIRT